MNSENQNANKFPEADSQLEAAVWSVLSEPVDSEAIERVKSRAKTLASSVVEPSRPGDSSNDKVEPVKNLKTASTKSLSSLSFLFKSLAACLLIGMAIAFFMMPRSNAFADVVEALQNAKSFSYRTLIYHKDHKDPIEAWTYIAEDGRCRQENAGLITIFDTKRNARLMLVESTKTAVVNPAYVEGVAVDIHQWHEALRSISEYSERELGEKTVDGRKVAGFEVDVHKSLKYSIWVDAENGDLVSIEQGAPVENGSIQKIVIDKISLIQVKDELFNLDIPSGYTAQKMDLSETLGKIDIHDSEGNLVEALKGFTSLSKGKFPKSLSDWSEWIALTTADKSMTDKEREQLFVRLGLILPYLTQMNNDDYQYVGEGKSTSDEKTIVFWYRKDGEVRAIYNDLSVGKIEDSNDLPVND